MNILFEMVLLQRLDPQGQRSHCGCVHGSLLDLELARDRPDWQELDPGQEAQGHAPPKTARDTWAVVFTRKAISAKSELPGPGGNLGVEESEV